MSAFTTERLNAFLAMSYDTVKFLSSFQIELFTTVILTGVMFLVHKLKSVHFPSFPFDKISIKFLYENPIGRLLLTEEGPTIWNFFINPYKTKLNKEHSIVQQANQIYKNPKQLNKGQSKSDDQLLKHEYVNTVPLAKLYRGLLLQGYMVSPKFLLQLNDFEVRKEDLFVVSYPRSGTTWTEEIVSCLHSQDKLDSLKNKPIHFRVIHIEVGRMFGQGEWLNSLKNPRLLATHLPYSHCPKQLQKLKCKVIYVARNIKDQLVSYYNFHQTAKYLGGKKWDWSEFLRLYERGDLVYGCWFDHVLPWYELSIKNPEKIMFLTYEQLNVNLSDSIKKISIFLNKPLDKQILDKIVGQCTFDQMKNNNSVNRMNIPINEFIVQTDGQPKFMRKGIIGDWKNYFSKEESDRFDRLFEQKAGSKGLKMAFTNEEAVQMYCK